MNVGRVVLVFCAVLAVLGAIAFGVVSLGPTRVSIDSGATLCDSLSPGKQSVFGIRVVNDSARPVTLGSLRADSQENVASIRAWALPATSKNGVQDRPGIATIPDVSGWSGRRSVEAALLPAHSAVVLAVSPRLEAGAKSGSASDYRLTYTPEGGITRTVHSGSVTELKARCG